MDANKRHMADAEAAAREDMLADGFQIVDVPEDDIDPAFDYDTETDYEEMGHYWDDLQEWPEDY